MTSSALKADKACVGVGLAPLAISLEWRVHELAAF
jgi:hypothetical protein